MDDDWDLRAVVRGCAAFSSSSCSLDCHPPSTFQPQDAHFLFCPDPLTEPTRRESIEELHDFIKPFFHKSPPLSPKIAPITRFSVIAGLPDLSPPPPSPPLPPPAPPQHRRQIKQQQQKNYSVSGACTSSVSATTAHNPSPKSKRRKIQMKTVCEVPAEGLSSDPWSWRKYGQKPIKGSPYPRGYYKCSTSKGCLARKQVERNRSDPGMFIVTYTAEHNHPMPTHRNSLAGSTRQKTDTPQTTTEGDDTDKPTCSSPVSLSPVTQDKTESREDEDEEFGGSDMVISEDFFEGLEEITSSGTGDCFLEDHFHAGLPFPWLVNNATTTAAGGG